MDRLGENKDKGKANERNKKGKNKDINNNTMDLELIFY